MWQKDQETCQKYLCQKYIYWENFQLFAVHLTGKWILPSWELAILMYLFVSIDKTSIQWPLKYEHPWEDHGNYWTEHFLGEEEKNKFLSWKCQENRDVAKDRGVNITVFMYHALILAGSQACALHTRGSWSSQLFHTRRPEAVSRTRPS